MTPEVANIIMQFMQRATMQGNEVGSYMRCMNELNAIANPQEMVPDMPVETEKVPAKKRAVKAA